MLLLLSATVYLVQGQNKAAAQAAHDSILPKIDSLKAAIVTAKLRPKIKGDTIEYNTGNILLRPHAAVEELLRRIPALQIDQNGNITYNGQKIDHLLVDGQDIFGSDPTIVTRNFEGSKIDRIQILDRKSDQSLFSGIDNGSRSKTLNLVLKESEKNGYFGKMEGGANTSGLYQADELFAKFRGKQQFTSLALASNTGTTSLSGESGGGSIFMFDENDDALGASAGRGIPSFYGSVLHYSDVWQHPEQHFMSNYQYGHSSTKPVTTSQTYQTLPDSIYGQYQHSASANQLSRNWLYGKYDLVYNSRSAVEFNFYGWKTSGQNQLTSTGTSTFNDTLVNSSSNNIVDEFSAQHLSANIAWRIQTSKNPKQIFSANVGFTKIDDDTRGFVYSIDKFYQFGTAAGIDTTNQRKEINNSSLALVGGVSIAQPLWKDAVIGVGYGFSTIGAKPIQETYNQTAGADKGPIDSLSSDFKTLTLTHTINLNVRGQSNHLDYTIGNNLYDYHYRQKASMVDTFMRLHHFTWEPIIKLVFSKQPNSRFQFGFRSSTVAPSPDQLVPATNNTNPLHLTLGNPNLKPQSNQQFDLSYRSFGKWIINTDLGIGISNNAISTRTITDSLGRQITEPFNVSGSTSSNFDLSINRNIARFEMGLHSSATYTQTATYVNADLSQNSNYTAGGGYSLGKYVDQKYSFQLNTNFTYLTQVSTVNAAAAIHYWTESYYGAMTWFGIKHFELHMDVLYTFQEKTSSFSENTSIVMLNAVISRNFANNLFTVRILSNNLLNENTGISRSSVNNVNIQSTTNVLGRYWMIAATYHFDRKFKRK